MASAIRNGMTGATGVPSRRETAAPVMTPVAGSIAIPCMPPTLMLQGSGCSIKCPSACKSAATAPSRRDSANTLVPFQSLARGASTASWRERP